MSDPVVVPLTPVASDHPIDELSRGQRDAPPTRRGSETIKFRIQQTSVYLHFGFYRDGRVCELFIDVGKTGSGMNSLFDALATTISIYLQTGGSIEDLASKYRHTSFEPSGPVVGPLGVENATSILDAIGQYLLKYKDGSPELESVAPEPST